MRFSSGPSSVPELRPLPFPPGKFVASGLAGSATEAQLIQIAEAALRREFSLLGKSLPTDKTIRWRRDYQRGIETGLDYFRRIPYLEASRAGDHKRIWELNRHHHLVAQVQAYLFTGRREFVEDVWEQLESWLDQNPFCRGINWVSALEVAFRALSWLWIEHFVGKEMPARLREPWRRMLFQHGRFLHNNLSYYFSPNTHLQGEALALQALGLAFGLDEWHDTGRRVLRELIHTHVRQDGSHFEQSSYYHVYALDMFILHAILEPAPREFLERVRKMAEYLWALLSPGAIPLLGDDDGGRLFHPYGNRRAFGRATLATCATLLEDTPWFGTPRDLEEQAAWWLGPDRIPSSGQASAVSHAFPDAGVYVLAEGPVHLVADVRGFGGGGAGHSHAHALHFTLRYRDIDVLIDPGTYTYVDDLEARELFRSTASHNTVSIDGRSQADPAGPFRWHNKPESAVLLWDPEPWRLVACTTYRGLSHERHFYWTKKVLFVFDRFTGIGEHQLDQHWHAGGGVELDDHGYRLPAGIKLQFPPGTSGRSEQGWVSSLPGERLTAPVVRTTGQATFPCFLAAALLMPGVEGELTVNVTKEFIGLAVAGEQVLIRQGV